MACCNSNFYSPNLNTPSCTLACLSEAEPGSTFVGADGSVWILTGTDPCDITNWTTQNDCCIRFTHASGFIEACCGDEVPITSSDGSITINLSGGNIDITVPSGTTPDPLPVVNFTEYFDGLEGTFQCYETSTQADVTIVNRTWSANGPGNVTISPQGDCNPTLTFSEPGVYTVGLQITDSNGNTSYIEKTFCVNAQGPCSSYFVLPNSAFANVNNPLDSEVSTWLSNNGPYNNGTIFVFGGTTNNPAYVWQTACSA